LRLCCDKKTKKKQNKVRVMEQQVQESANSLETKFQIAVDFIKSLPKEGSQSSLPLSTDELLFFYSRYKQATEGPCNIPKPSVFQPVARSKWCGILLTTSSRILSFLLCWILTNNRLFFFFLF
jgi:acyl-CoA-binding protein